MSQPLSTRISPKCSRVELISVWVCLAALSILNSLHIVDVPTLAGWLSERQLPSGGLNGRPEKLEDVCYSWWDLASLSILGRLGWINRDKLIGFILESQVCRLLSSFFPFPSSLLPFFPSSLLPFFPFCLSTSKSYFYLPWIRLQSNRANI